MNSFNKEILRLAIPSILANITVPLVGLLDLAVAGHLDGDSAVLIGSIAIGGMLFDLLYWGFEFLRIGTGGLTAQAYGRSDWKECGTILLRGVSLALIIALGILLIQWPFTKFAFLIVKCSDEVKDLALQYFFIRVWAAPATLSLMSLKGWFIGMQDSVSSMFADLIVNGVNVIASILLAKKIGFAGIALGTVIAQYSGLLFSLIIIKFKYLDKISNGLNIKYLSGNLKDFLTLNKDLFIRSVGLIIIYISFTTISARYGDLLLSTGNIIMKLLMLFSYFTDGFAFAGEALTGKFYGMNDKESVRRTVKDIFIWSMSIGMFFILIYYVLGEPLLHLLTSDTAVIDSCKRFFIWLLPMPLVGCAAFTWDGIYVGATASKALRNSTIAAVIAYFAVWFIGVNMIPNSLPASQSGVMAIHILLAAYFAHLLARTIWQTALYHKCILDPVGK